MRDKFIAGLDLLARVEQVAVSGFSLGMRPGEGLEPFTAQFELLVELGQAAIENNGAVLIHIDEVQNIADEAARSQLLIALGDALAHEVTMMAPGGVAGSSPGGGCTRSATERSRRT